MAVITKNSVAPKQKGLFGLMGSFAFKYVTPFVVALTFHEDVERVFDYVLYHNVPVAVESYQDPRGLDTKVYTNEKGQRQTYMITTGETPQKIPICQDLLPAKYELEKRVLERYKSLTPEEAVDYVGFLKKQQEILSQKIGQK
jgi:hypothetical protein